MDRWKYLPLRPATIHPFHCFPVFPACLPDLPVLDFPAPLALSRLPLPVLHFPAPLALSRPFFPVPSFLHSLCRQAPAVPVPPGLSHLLFPRIHFPLPSHHSAYLPVLSPLPLPQVPPPPHLPPRKKKQPQRLLPLQSQFQSVPDRPFPLLLHKRLSGFPVSLRAHRSSRRAPARRICRPSLFYQPFSLSPIQFARPDGIDPNK